MSATGDRPSTSGLTILLIEDDVRFAERLAGFLRKEKHHVLHAGSGADGVRLVDEAGPDLVLLDLVLPDMNGIETLKRFKALAASPRVIVMTAHGSIATAVEAMRLGATDYLTKPVDLDALRVKLDQARELLGMRSELDYLLDRERRRSGFENLVGDSRAMRAVYQKIRDVAKTENTTVLVTGPSGTGKELVSRAIHSLSARSKKPLMQIDCTAIPISLLESQLLGHERGAFTGADRTQKGLLEVADHGTLFLDEIGDMPLELQSKFLRVLEERQFRRLGGTRDFHFDVRVIAATNQKLDLLIDQGRFRRDLLFRLKVFQIELPPLCDREGDILALANLFLDDYAKAFRKPIRGLSADAERRLTAYSFPGNVRELRNIIEQAVILAKGNLLTGDLLFINDQLSAAAPSNDTSACPALSLDALGDHPLQTAERHLLQQALKRSGGNKKEAAKLLHISRFSLQRKLERLKLDPLDSE